ncbi:large-conductance mechanosensitive channel protein MscL [Marinicella gelatinilytica]|uniref:large-conductance mechanosensitive channel protein MscL n=1 Tax=Marinicella gelatinilytica TaxID=2996017 RepID=UPI002260A4CB|nr:large-conductance mechanosensitive channel protein MscL [Marinicella gelatinilytica]MCX7545880.1 large-conductance mechanosensitive channel protein MscL [Marinicella gelatinilytica]
MGMMAEFKKFAVKGNVMDMAVGIIIGAAFGKIVTAFVNGVLMPPLGLLIGGVDFSELAIVLKAGTENTEPVLLQWGLFVQTAIDFLIIAFAIFLVVKVMNNLKAKEEAKPEAPPEPSKEELLLMEIRDLLKDKS